MGILLGASNLTGAMMRKRGLYVLLPRFCVGHLCRQHDGSVSWAFLYTRSLEQQSAYSTLYQKNDAPRIDNSLIMTKYDGCIRV